jgi:hypothetical protein
MSRLFTPEVVREAFLRSKGRCECRRLECEGHGRSTLTLSSGDSRCSRTFFFPDRGEKWIAVVRDPDGPYNAGNCEILCMQCAEERRRLSGLKLHQGE